MSVVCKTSCLCCLISVFPHLNVFSFVLLPWLRPPLVSMKLVSAAPSVWSSLRTQSPSHVDTATVWAAWLTCGTMNRPAAVHSAGSPLAPDPHWAGTPCWWRCSRVSGLWRWALLPLPHLCMRNNTALNTPRLMCPQFSLRGLTGRWLDSL